jgi:hypothetical protein
MRVPKAIMFEIERVGRLILQGEITYDDAIDAIEPFLNKEEYRLFTQEILRRYIRNQIKAWISSQLAVAADDEETGQQTLPFPDLPALLEVSPGTFKHQNAMAIRDWNAAVVQAQTKAANAAGYLERVLRARDRALELLGEDETFGEATG